MKIKEITNYLSYYAPLSLQESYDNSGLIIGNADNKLTGVLITIDITEEVVAEAVKKKCNLIISHHPLIFNGLKRITGKNYVERTVIQAIKNEIAIYSSHTNIDAIKGGVNTKICQKLGLKDCRILLPKSNELRKLVTFVPKLHADKVRKAIFSAGAGHIGNYDNCSFNVSGTGTFRGNSETNPFAGEKGKLQFEPEIKIETIYPKFIENKLINALIKAHPYEETAYDIYPLNNIYENAGFGMFGFLDKEKSETDFLTMLKKIFKTKTIKHTSFRNKPIKKVALCGGAGSFLLSKAIQTRADLFVSSDFKYHEFFNSENKILIADIGHYESEQFTKELFYEIITNKFHSFACFLSEINTNPVNFF